MSDTIPYFQRMQMIKLGILPKEAVAKPKKPIAKKSKNKIAMEKQQAKVEIVKPKKAGFFDASKIDEVEEQTEKQKWFDLIRKKLVSTCQCGCGNKSQKNDDMYFRHSCCHIFPQRLFPSIQFHELNYVERAFWGGCHSVMDDTSMDRWVNMADFEDIKAKFYILAPLLTEKEKANKFYSHLEKLVHL